jgi:Fe-S cluster biogenesis protein NfuA
MKAVSVYMESNPNPNSLKFVVNYEIAPTGESFDFPDIESAEGAPLAKALFGLEYVERVFIMNNFVTVTKGDAFDWFEIQNPIRDFISEYLRNDNPVFDASFAAREGLTPEEVHAEPENELELKIKAVLEEYVKPAVEMDGGAITYNSFDDGILKVQLEGSCNGCPSSMVTLKSGIENLMKRMVPEVQSVEAS